MQGRTHVRSLGDDLTIQERDSNGHLVRTLLRNARFPAKWTTSGLRDSDSICEEHIISGLNAIVKRDGALGQRCDRLSFSGC